MRISNLMLSQKSADRVSSQLSRLADLQDQLGTGKRLRRPSDDPAATAQAMEVRRAAANMEQYNKNAEEAKNMLSFSDSTLGQAYSILAQAKQTALAGATDTQSAESRQALADQVSAQIDSLERLANTRMRDKYLFAGQQVSRQPFAEDGAGNIVYQGDTRLTMVEVGQNDAVAANVPGSKAFGQVFETLQKLRDNLTIGGNPAEIDTDRLKELQADMDRIVQVRARLGERAAYLERTQDKIMRFQEEFSSWTDNLENVEIAKAVVDLKAQENAYQAVVAGTARLFQPSLLDFLR
ncbi:MAG: flagellar hook-associated protein FlgL [Armatimonadetes bacterium]|nr:flagellar hook-associated protein FlgL [Armatimonadota bacterium]